MDATKLAISIRGLGKCYEIDLGYQKKKSERSGFWHRLRLLRGRGNGDDAGKKIVWVLRDLDIEIPKGQVVGVIGRNGAGKSTLLRILSRVTKPSEGYAEIRGHVSSMLAVGTGFHPAFTGRENIYLNGMLLGLRRADVERRIEDIIEFSEIGDYIDAPVKTYSSGMKARLAFAVAVQLSSEVMLLDEVLAVGDAGFRKKCLGLLQELKRQGRTVLLVTHNTAYVQEYCDRCILLDRGRMVMDGDPDKVVSYYLQNMFPSGDLQDLSERDDREGNGVLKVVGFHIEDIEGRRTVPVSGGDYLLCLHFVVEKGTVLHDVEVGMAIGDARGSWLMRLSTTVTGGDIPELSGEGVLKCHVSRLPLAQGEYRMGFRITSNNEVLDYIVNAAKFEVHEGDFWGTGKAETHSPILVDHMWTFEIQNGAGDMHGREWEQMGGNPAIRLPH